MKNTELLKDETLTEKFIKKWFWLYFFTFLIAPTGYIIRVIISNDLWVDEVWILYSIISFVWLISVYNDLGLTESLKYFLPKYRIEKKYDYVKTIIFISLGIQLITGIVLAVILFLGSDWLATNYFHSAEAAIILKYFCIYFLFINIFQVIQSIFTWFQDTFNQKLIDFIKMWSITLFTIIFFLGWKWLISNYSLAWIWWTLLSVFVWIVIFFSKYKSTIISWKLNFDKDMIKTYKNYALMVFIWTNAGVLLTQIDQQMIIFFLGPTSAWYYSNYLSLLLISSIIVWPIWAFLFPLVSELTNKNEKRKLKLLQNSFYKYFSVFAISLGTLFFVLWPEIASILFGVKFLKSWELLQYSSIFLIFNILYGINFNILAGLGKVKERVKIIIIAMITNLILNAILINTIGIIWAIIATIIWWIIIFILSSKIINKSQIVTIDWKYFIKNIIFIWIWWWIIYLIKNHLFILEDIYRYQNLLYLSIIFSFFLVYLCVINWKEILILKREIFKIKL